MVVPTWYIRERCPDFVYLPPETQQAWLLLLSAEFGSTRQLSAIDPVTTWQIPRTENDRGMQMGDGTTSRASRLESTAARSSLTVRVTRTETGVRIVIYAQSQTADAEMDCLNQATG